MSKQEELQKQKQQDAKESKAYDILFDLLEHEPDDAFPGGFSKRVIRKIQKRESNRRSWYYFWSSLAVLFCAISTLSVLVFYFGKEQLSAIFDATGWAVFAGVSIVLIQYLDRKLVRKRGMQII